MTRKLSGMFWLTLVSIGMGFGGAGAFAGEPDAESGKAALPMCPIMDEAIDFTVSTPTDAGPVYFCCPGCIKKYNAKPEQYAEKVAAQRKALADRPKVQVICPITDNPVDHKVFIEHNGQKVYFCKEGCAEKYQADPAKYAAKLANGYTYQTVCPVMKEEIDPAVFVDLPTSQRVYLCCKKCVKRFRDNPIKYKDHLAEQGVHLDEEKLKG